ncbi:MAG: S41 family peptidase [Bacilli bacterium]|nr:S41 family peptidase [Bacilli bacterium]
MDKETNKTEAKLNKLEEVIGTLAPKKEKVIKKKGNYSFRTREVIILIFITMVVSLFMGSMITQKFMPIATSKVDGNLGELIKNYNYITKNYNGQINEEELVDEAINAMLSKLDKNSNYIDADTSKNFNILLEGKYSGLGIQVYNKGNDIIIYSVFDDSPAAKAGLKAGDVIASINGKSTKGMSSSELAKIVKSSKSRKISLTYIRDGGKEQTVNVNISSVSINSVVTDSYVKKDKNIGYIGLGIFANNSYGQFKKELEKLEAKKLDALIIDLRGNSGGYLYVAENIISLFVDSSHVIYKIEKNKDITSHYSKGDITKDYKIVVLIDGNSASASEIVASALSEQIGATLVGMKSYGKGTVQEVQNLKNGDKYKLTTKNWLTSKGVWINNKGLSPDIEVKLDEKYFENPDVDNDNQLQRAIEEAIK